MMLRMKKLKILKKKMKKIKKVIKISIKMILKNNLMMKIIVSQ